MNRFISIHEFTKNRQNTRLEIAIWGENRMSKYAPHPLKQGWNSGQKKKYQYGTSIGS